MKRYPIVILHGWGLSSEKYSGLKQALKTKGFDTYAIDLPGFGAAAQPERPLTLVDYVHYVHAYINIHHIKDPIFIGHSFGGRVALKYQMQYPVNALILTGAPGYASIKKKLFIPIAKIGKFFLPNEHVRSWYYALVGAREYNKAQGAMKETFKNIVSEDLVPYMKEVRVPTLLVWGDRDLITPLWIAQKMMKSIRGAKLIVIPDSDHGVSYKLPKKFAEAIVPWIQDL